MLDGQGYDISCDLVMKVSVGWSYWTGKNISFIGLFFHVLSPCTLTINK